MGAVDVVRDFGARIRLGRPAHERSEPAYLGGARSAFTITRQFAAFSLVILIALGGVQGWMLARIQGFHLARPMPAPDLERWLARFAADSFAGARSSAAAAD